MNPADPASRDLKTESLIKGKNWIRGQHVWWKKESEWPERPDQSSHVLEDDNEAKRSPVICLSLADKGVASVNKFIDHYSQWMDEKCAAAPQG